MVSQSSCQLSEIIILVYKHSDALPFSYLNLQDEENVVVFGVVLRNMSIAQTEVHNVVPEVTTMAVLARRLIATSSIEATLSLLHHTAAILHVIATIVIVVAIV